MQSNAMLGQLNSNNVYVYVYGEAGQTDTGSACSTNSECKTKYLGVIF